ncbi:MULTISPECIES: YbhB/YbcL family Raf kinase inhibitor-like protein [unclassified Cupriavidus]|uniref:YbhB/YbcL family Raf kinase inhibitor-like protein n=1 Tax=unclassified Cupriavidus TaxID=2640874 RepID=UPI00087EB0D4|nr:YbhB/YbcL family Raf kinase inhibitor-like protein [Cupriavidus sp. YR651]SDD17622.1 phospholipid-binding protein, PBP family [Cupriavidus sp. YR651]
MPARYRFAAAAALLAATTLAHAAGMEVTSTSFLEGGTIPTLHGNDTDNCGGKGVSPQVGWSNLPPKARSVVVFLYDPDGQNGLGVSHWVAYNIAASRNELKQGEGQAEGKGATVGKNIRGDTVYRGPCPPVGDLPHHYTLTVIATDLEPNALQPGMTRQEVLDALKGHALGGQSIVGRYAR